MVEPATFPGQGTVSAAEHERLRRDYDALEDQLGAASDVLEAMGRSAAEPDTVLATIVASARRLCRSDAAHLYLLEDGVYRLRNTVGLTEESHRLITEHPISADRDTLTGRVGLERRTLQIPDVLADPDYGRHDLQRAAGFRTVVAAPMIVDDRVVGALNVWRNDVRPFDDREMAIVSAFAVQAAMAVNAVMLVQQLERASRHKSEFLASMSHELRTPLNAVIGFSEVLLERMFGDINERQEEYLRDILGSGRHLLELLNEILDLSKVEAGRMELEYSSFDLPTILDEAGGMLRERASGRGVDLRIEAAPDVGAVYSDQLRLKQVLLNLMTNAVKFTGEGGSVVVRAERRPAELDITVTDTGVGVPEDDRERIFESFQQGGRGSPREEGTGLGLTLSRRLVELLGGRMWLESEVGVGSTFGFSLPAQRPPQEPGAETGAGPHAYVGHVVIVEDDRPSLDLFTAYLSAAALRVTPARDGPSGLEAVRRGRPDAVLLDIRLPGIDGWAVLEALQADPGTRDIPVIVVSIVDERSRGAALGAADYLVKPVSREALLGALSRVGASPAAQTPRTRETGGP
ncbi:GAF domain-containing hybrid sensor histidine kinase/response regulator [Nocardioides sp. YIM 152315]|uniref:ATP-binding response regulator n=1 Tax=Nocardioides sp. YIM 152315 TaxID=3031760 RepID=UPI0023DBD4E7|nr:GAF domain-containing hybrid sensor histidine kinase/response regulator [Nocardioides sp. YIM 152315]MDF1602599.1 ATP-binding protein [Nocardioides sp. YIM 152315]